MEAAPPAATPSLKETSETVFEHLPADPLKEQIDALRVQQARVRQEKKDLSKAVRNATKKQQRLRRRTRLMSSEDLVAALLMRKEAAERSARSREGNTSTAANGTLSQSSGDPPPGLPAASVAPLEADRPADADAERGISADERRDE